MALVLDTGALAAYDRGERQVAAVIRAAQRRRQPVRTSAGCVAQAWRSGGPRQALLARLLRGVGEHPLDHRISRQIGQLCARAARPDVVDSHVALIAGDGDLIVTSDPDDVGALVRTAGSNATIRVC